MPIEAPLRYRLQRRPSGKVSTIGEVSVDDFLFCYTVEDVVREVSGVPVSEWKVQDETAIPQGSYRVIVTKSFRFGRPLPILVDVPGFSGIRFHPGNTAVDTKGCILPGMREQNGMVFDSRGAMKVWQHDIELALLAGREVWIDILNSGAADE